MEKFCEHIEKLLAQHDYVVVPDLGGFVVQTQSAKIMPDCILPPLATISFNPLMHNADGMLALEIARSQQISYRQSMELIEKEVQLLKVQLNSLGEVELGGLGTFIQLEGGSLQFIPKSRATFLPLNFGLEDVYVSPRTSKHNEEKKKLTIVMPSRNAFKYGVAAALVFGMLFISPKVSDVRQADYASLASVAFVDSAQDNSLVVDSLADKVAVDSVENKFVDKVKDTDTIPEKAQSFHVVVASLSTKESAEKMCNDLETSGFKHALILEPANTYRVAVKSFPDKNEAVRYMENLRKTDRRFETAWVLCD